MKMQGILVLIVTSFIACYSIANSEQYTFPVLKDDGRDSVRTGRKAGDGWGEFSYMVTRDGDVEDIVLLDSGGDPFNLEKLEKFLRSRSFEPATLNGSSVSAPLTTFQTFVVLSAGRPSFHLGEDFMEQYQRVIDAIKNKNYVLAREQQKLLASEKTRSFAQQGWLAWVSAMLDYQEGNWASYSRNLSIAKALSGYNMDIKTKTLVHNNYFENLLFNAKYIEAWELAYEIKQSDEFAFPEGYPEKMLEKAKAAIQQEQAAISKVTLLEDVTWSARFQQEDVTIELESGEVTSIRHRCFGVNQHYQGDIAFPVTLKGDAPQCSVFIKGKAGTKLTISHLSL